MAALKGLEHPGLTILDAMHTPDEGVLVKGRTPEGTFIYRLGLEVLGPAKHKMCGSFAYALKDEPTRSLAPETIPDCPYCGGQAEKDGRGGYVCLFCNTTF